MAWCTRARGVGGCEVRLCERCLTSGVDSGDISRSTSMKGTGSSEAMREEPAKGVGVVTGTCAAPDGAVDAGMGVGIAMEVEATVDEPTALNAIIG